MSENILLTVTVMALLTLTSCKMGRSEGIGKTEIRLVTLAPGHFHAALVQKTSYPHVSCSVYVYSKADEELQEHLKRIEAYNTRALQPTNWNEIVYTGDDFLEKMLEEHKGNVVVAAGLNSRKMTYIEKSIGAGLNVLADKPMAISIEDFRRLEACFDVSTHNGTLLYDIMTERYEITNILQREFAHSSEIYGSQIAGSPESPGIEMESVHYFLKTVSGVPLIRPVWFFDTEQQGAAIVDVGVHLVDLVQWELFPDQAINYRNDIEIIDADGWHTSLEMSQFTAVTGHTSYPEWLQKDVVSDRLFVYANGDVSYRIKGVYAKLAALWKYSYPEGGGDTHYSVMRGSKAHLIIKQDIEQNYIPTLYIHYAGKSDIHEYEVRLIEAMKRFESRYPGVTLRKTDEGEWEVIIPEIYRNGHEAHFGQVTENYLKYLREGDMPQWETPCMLAKYYVTTHALDMAKCKRAK